MITIRVLRELGELEALAERWDALVEASPHATPFSSAAWNVACWRNLRHGKLVTLAFEWDSQLVGVAPLYREPGFRQRLRWIGMVAPASRRHYGVSDYGDLAVTPGQEAAVTAAFAEWLTDHPNEWRTLDLDTVPRDGVITGRMQAAGYSRKERGVSLTVTLPNTWEEYVQAAPTNMKQPLERIPRKLSREHEVVYDRASTPEEVEQTIADLVRLHQARWEAAGESGALDSPAIIAIARESALGALKRGWLDLWALRVNGETVAVQYNLRLKSSVYYYASGYAEGELARYSLGRTLMAHTIRTAIAEGVRRYDFLRGDYEWKRRFGGVPEPRYFVSGYATPTVAAALGLFERSREAARAVRNAARGRKLQVVVGAMA